MDLGIENKKALIIGASKGLGKQIASELAEHGVQIAIVSRNEEQLKCVHELIGGKENGHYYYAVDLMMEDSCKELYENVVEEFGIPDIIIYNIGGTLDIKDHFTSMFDYEKVWRFNLGISIELNRFFVPYMVQKKWGRIIHISSTSAIMADASLPYSSAKAALNTYVKGLSYKVSKSGVTVNSVMPGPFEFEGSHWNTISKNQPERYNKFINEKMAVGRLGRPEDISSMVVFLCSDKTSFITGSVLAVDGGIH